MKFRFSSTSRKWWVQDLVSSSPESVVRLHHNTALLTEIVLWHSVWPPDLTTSNWHSAQRLISLKPCSSQVISWIKSLHCLQIEPWCQACHTRSSRCWAQPPHPASLNLRLSSCVLLSRECHPLSFQPGQIHPIFYGSSKCYLLHKASHLTKKTVAIKRESLWLKLLFTSLCASTSTSPTLSEVSFWQLWWTETCLMKKRKNIPETFKVNLFFGWLLDLHFTLYICKGYKVKFSLASPSHPVLMLTGKKYY